MKTAQSEAKKRNRSYSRPTLAHLNSSTLPQSPQLLVVPAPPSAVLNHPGRAERAAARRAERALNRQVSGSSQTSSNGETHQVSKAERKASRRAAIRAALDKEEGNGHNIRKKRGARAKRDKGRASDEHVACAREGTRVTYVSDGRPMAPTIAPNPRPAPRAANITYDTSRRVRSPTPKSSHRRSSSTDSNKKRRGILRQNSNGFIKNVTFAADVIGGNDGWVTGSDIFSDPGSSDDSAIDAGDIPMSRTGLWNGSPSQPVHHSPSHSNPTVTQSTDSSELGTTTWGSADEKESDWNTPQHEPGYSESSTRAASSPSNLPQQKRPNGTASNQQGKKPMQQRPTRSNKKAENSQQAKQQDNHQATQSSNSGAATDPISKAPQTVNEWDDNSSTAPDPKLADVAW